MQLLVKAYHNAQSTSTSTGMSMDASALGRGEGGSYCANPGLHMTVCGYLNTMSKYMGGGGGEGNQHKL